MTVTASSETQEVEAQVAVMQYHFNNLSKKVLEYGKEQDILEDLIDIFPFPVSLWDDTKMVTANGAFCELVGYDAKELVAHHWIEFVWEEDITSSYEVATEQYHQDGGAETAVLGWTNRWKHADGHPVRIWWWSSPTRDGKGLAICFSQDMMESFARTLTHTNEEFPDHE